MELLKMNIERSNIRVRNDFFFIFQEKNIYISNNKECIEVNVKYDFFTSRFKIIGYKTLAGSSVTPGHR